MDSLDLIAGPAGPLLRRVDEVLSVAGAPGDHGVWRELRRVRLLPGDAVQAVTALRSKDLVDAPPELRAGARTYAALAESLPGPEGWSGDAADAYEVARRRLADHVSGEADGLDERLEATADLAEALVDWLDQTRGDLAGTLADVLGSAQALALSSGTPAVPSDPAEIQAAADVAERILHTVAESYELAADLLQGSADLATAVRI
jgi:hypothetical protein